MRREEINVYTLSQITQYKQQTNNMNQKYPKQPKTTTTNEKIDVTK